jgi:hypothetical protein
VAEGQRLGQSRAAAVARTISAVSIRRTAVKPTVDPVRARRLRADAKRPMSVNLSEGIALSHKLLKFVGVARRG